MSKSSGKGRKIHRAWIILGLCFVGLLAAQGVRLSFGAFVNPWQKDFNADRATISLVSFVSFIVYGVTQPIVGRLTDRYGVRKILTASALLVGLSLILISMVQTTILLLFLYGIVASLGFGGTSGVVASVAVTKWFKTNRGLAFGLLEAGQGAGQFVLVPSSLFLIDGVGWRTTMLLMAGLLCVIVFPLLLLFLRSTPAEVNLQPLCSDELAENAATEQTIVSDNTPKPKISSIFKTRAFWGLALPFFICGITTTGMIDTHLIPFAHDHGYSTDITSATVSVLAAFNIIGTLASGPLSDRFDNRVILGTLYLIRAFTLIFLLVTNQAVGLVLFGVIFGLVDFAVLAPTQLLASRYFQGHSVGLVFGLLSMSHQLGSALGAYLPGLLYTWTGNYNLAFIGAAAILEVGALLSYTLPKSRKTKAISPQLAAVSQSE